MALNEDMMPNMAGGHMGSDLVPGEPFITWNRLRGGGDDHRQGQVSCADGAGTAEGRADGSRSCTAHLSQHLLQEVTCLARMHHWSSEDANKGATKDLAPVAAVAVVSSSIGMFVDSTRMCHDILKVD